jgi:hypothetical protein
MVFSSVREKFFHPERRTRSFFQIMPPKNIFLVAWLGQVGAADFLRAWIAALIFLRADDALLNKSCFMIAPAAGLGKSGNFRFLCKNFSYLDSYSLLTRII